MNSPLKIVLVLGLMLAVVFAVTFFSQVTPTEPDTKTGDTTEAAAPKPLVFFTNTRRWDPASESLPDQAFTGFYEPGQDTLHGAAFWFENRTPTPVTMKLLGVSCSACSAGRLAPIPPAAVRQFLQMTAVSALPIGPVAACPPGLAGAGAELVSKLQWQTHDFHDASQAVYTVPPAADVDGWSPQWGILELQFKVRPNPNVPLRAAFVTQAEGSDQPTRDEFSIWFEPAAAFELDKTAIDAGELTDNASAQTHELTVFSSTRSRGEMPPLTVRVLMPAGAGGEPGPFVTAETPKPLPDDELDRFAAELSAAAQKPVRVRSAFRIPVTVRPRVGDDRIDIGRLERDIWVSASIPGAEPKRAVLRGVVRGPVWLASGNEVNLGTFKSALGASEQVIVTTERTGVDLALVRGESRPEYLEVGLNKLPDAGDRGQYQLRVTMPRGKHQGEIQDGVVVLEVKGPNPQRFRVPVKGRGTF
jgi:hypothetical protein